MKMDLKSATGTSRFHVCRIDNNKFLALRDSELDESQRALIAKEWRDVPMASKLGATIKLSKENTIKREVVKQEQKDQDVLDREKVFVDMAVLSKSKAKQ